MNVNIPFISRESRSLDLFQQLQAGEHPPRLKHQGSQDVELGCGKRLGLAVHRYCLLGDVQPDGAGLKYGLSI
jgi:hypothetical protein